MINPRLRNNLNNIRKLNKDIATQSISINNQRLESAEAFVKTRSVLEENLISKRLEINERISRRNEDFIAKTADVLNQDTIDTLVQFSNINAPTLTSIFAGWEMAKASRADRLQLATETRNAQDEAGFETDQMRAASQISAADTLFTARDQSLARESEINSNLMAGEIALEEQEARFTDTELERNNRLQLQRERIAADQRAREEAQRIERENFERFFPGAASDINEGESQEAQDNQESEILPPLSENAANQQSSIEDSTTTSQSAIIEDTSLIDDTQNQEQLNPFMNQQNRIREAMIAGNQSPEDIQRFIDQTSPVENNSVQVEQEAEEPIANETVVEGQEQILEPSRQDLVRQAMEAGMTSRDDIMRFIIQNRGQ